MSIHFSAAASLLLALAEDGDTATKVTDADWERLAESVELTDKVRKAIKDIVDEDRRAKQKIDAERSRVRGSHIAKLAEFASTPVDEETLDKLIACKVTLVRQLIDLSKAELAEKGLLASEIDQLDAALDSVGLERKEDTESKIE